MYTQGDTSSVLLPVKFCLIFIQNVLVYTILTSMENYIYTEVGTTATESEKSRQQQFLLWFGIVTMGLCYIEMVFMIIGISVPFRFAKWNLLQIVLHFLGCLFTLWFILDTWNYTRITNIFIITGLLPFCLEIVMIQ